MSENQKTNIFRDLDAEGCVLPPVTYCNCEEKVKRLEAEIAFWGEQITKLTEVLHHYFSKEVVETKK